MLAGARDPRAAGREVMPNAVAAPSIMKIPIAIQALTNASWVAS